MAKPKTKLEEHRRLNFLNQQEVSVQLGMNQNSYSKIERGERGLSLENAKKLKLIFKLNTIDELLEDERIISQN